MGKCLSSEEPANIHGRAASLSGHEDPELGQGIRNGGTDLTSDDIKYNKKNITNKNGIKYTDASHIYNDGNNTHTYAEMANNTKNINKFLKMDHKNNMKIKKLLLLGAGSSGKSTLFRQLKCIHGPGFEASEFIESKNVIRSNCVLGILTLLKKSQELYDSNKEKHSDFYIELNQSLINDIHFILKFQAETFEEDDKILSRDLLQLGESINRLWKLSQIQITYSKRQYYSIIENKDFFLGKSLIIFNHKYEPKQEDHLKCRIRT
eukprot:887962_1